MVSYTSRLFRPYTLNYLSYDIAQTNIYLNFLTEILDGEAEILLNMVA